MKKAISFWRIQLSNVYWNIFETTVCIGYGQSNMHSHLSSVPDLSGGKKCNTKKEKLRAYWPSIYTVV
jgi:hypothetical protein